MGNGRQAIFGMVFASAMLWGGTSPALATGPVFGTAPVNTIGVAPNQSTFVDGPNGTRLYCNPMGCYDGKGGVYPPIGSRPPTGGGVTVDTSDIKMNNAGATAAGTFGTRPPTGDGITMDTSGIKMNNAITPERFFHDATGAVIHCTYAGCYNNGQRIISSTLVLDNSHPLPAWTEFSPAGTTSNTTYMPPVRAPIISYNPDRPVITYLSSAASSGGSVSTPTYFRERLNWTKTENMNRLNDWRTGR
jgi:hypothetical protein